MTRKAWINGGRSVLCAVATLAITAASMAIQPAQWTHTTQADFVPGESEGVVVTNLGDVKLASSTSTVGTMPEGVNIIFDMRLVASGDLYIAAGPGGQLLRRRGDQVTQVALLENESIYALDQTADGGLLLAISGATSRLAVLDGDQVKTVVELPGVRYIWDTIVDGNDVYLATGPDGKLLHVNMNEAFTGRARAAGNDGVKPVATPTPTPTPAVPGKDKAAPDAKPAPAPGAAANVPAEPEPLPLPPGVRVLLDTVQANLLCLGRDKQGRLFAGTDTDGLVYRVTLSPTGEADAFVLYDATEPEIFTLLVTADGTVYVGTADADQARPGRMEAAVEQEGGRPIPIRLPPLDKPELPIPPKPDPKATTDAAAPAKTPAPDAATPAPGDAPKTGADAQPAEKPDALVAEPTQQQYDQLRDEIRNRLSKARTTGELQAGPSAPRSAPRRSSGPSPAPSRSNAGGAAKQGNAVYRIDTSGFVTEVFRESALILKLLDDGDKLLVATGAEGQLYRIDIAAEETTIIADLEPEQIPALIKGSDGRILVGTGSPAMLVRLDEGFAATGTYTSPVLDATQISLWGKLMLTAAIPEGTSVSVQTRSGNVQDPERANWSKWSVPRNLTPDDAVGPLTPREVAIVSPPARFLQYRLALTGTGKATSVVDRVSLAYVVPNLRPVVTAIRAVYPNELKPGAKPAARGNANNPNENPLPELTTLNVEWEATDANNDQLRYTLEYRMAGSDKWLPLMEDITTTTYEWNTRRVPDGRYVLRVTATDAPDNPATMAKTVSRQSDPILIDNAAPTFGERQTRVQNQTATISAALTDNLSPIRLVQYAVDNTGKWNAVLPDDLIFDSTKETITVKIADLSPGSHVITLRASDSQGNTRYVAETVEVK